VLPIAVSANGRVNVKAALRWRASHAESPMSRATASARARPAMASIRVSAIGIDAVMPVVVATPLSTTSRRSAA
jgi:hypothetical protein